ncbi:MAG: hypothetical protein HUU35_17665, partial [Armatimonadetes bacterium]|nr:hypothetical protein [Armatimonadota bacterium]
DPGTLGGSITDKRTQRTWTFGGALEMVAQEARTTASGVSLSAGDPARDSTLQVTVAPAE